MQVLDDEDGGAFGGEALEEGAPGREVLLARGLFCLEAEQGAQAGAQAVALVALGQHGLETGLSARHAVAFKDAGGGAHDLGERPEGDPGAEGQAAALAPGDEGGLVVEAAG